MKKVNDYLWKGVLEDVFDDFPQRMYTYFYRIFDKFGKRISAYAILTESTVKVRAESYVSEFLGTKLEYHYNVYKISKQSNSLHSF